MASLVMALYAEGRTDQRFLSIIIQRTAENILAQWGRTTVDVLEPISLNRDIDRRLQRRVDRIVEAARRAAGYHILFIHADADHPTAERALEERIRPGIEAARSREDTCQELIPLVPVQMTEAWMLADPEALRQVIGTSVSASALELPVRPRHVELESNPKQKLQRAIDIALASRARRRRLRIGELYEPLAYQISLDRLQRVPSYQRFVGDFTDALTRLGLVILSE